MGKMGELAASDLQRHRKDDYATSVKAAKAVKSRAPSVMMKILDVIKNAGDRGLTDEEIRDYMINVLHEKPLPDGGYRKRRSDLVAMGLVIWNGRVRKSASGRDVNVWAAT